MMGGHQKKEIQAEEFRNIRFMLGGFQTWGRLVGGHRLLANVAKVMERGANGGRNRGWEGGSWGPVGHPGIAGLPRFLSRGAGQNDE